VAMGDESTERLLLDAEMTRALSALDLARYRSRQQRKAFGGVDRDVARRLEAALRRVWWLESQAVAAALVAA